MYKFCVQRKPYTKWRNDLTPWRLTLLLSKQQGGEKSRENAHCEKCRENAFDNLAEVQLHFKTLHQLNVNIKVEFVKD